MILSCFKVLLVIVIAGSCLSVEDCGEVKDHHWKRNSNNMIDDEHLSTLVIDISQIEVCQVNASDYQSSLYW